MLWHKAAGAGGVGGTGGSGGATFVGATSANGSSSLSLSGISGLSSGHTVIFVSMDDNREHRMETPTDWSGMVAEFPLNYYSPLNINYLAAYSKDVSTSSSVSLDETVDALAAVAFSGMGTPPSIFTASTYGFGNYDSQDLPSMDVLVENSTCVIVAMIDDDSATITTVPAGYTLAVQDGRTGGSIAILYKTGLPVGTEDPGTLVWSSSDSLLTYAYIIPPE